MKGLAEAIELEMTSLPLLVVELARVLLDQIDGLSKKIAELEKATVQEATRGATMRRLQTMPGVGPIPRWRLRLSRRRWPSSDAAATFPLGSGLFPGNIRRAASRFSAKPRRWASVTSGAC